jgi:hypothetical protein
MRAIGVRFEQKPRGGLVSLWVNDRNIWDLDKRECTVDVLKAIQSALSCGMELYRDSIQEQMLEIPRIKTDGKFKEKQ